MNRLHFSPEADHDLNDIYDYLAQFNATTAAQTVQRIEQACRMLARFPGMGAARDALQPGLLSFPCNKYVIFYRITDDGIQIVRILHGSRNFSAVFGQP